MTRAAVQRRRSASQVRSKLRRGVPVFEYTDEPGDTPTHFIFLELKDGGAAAEARFLRPLDARRSPARSRSARPEDLAGAGAVVAAEDLAFAGEVILGADFLDRIDARQGQLAGQHQARNR